MPVVDDRDLFEDEDLLDFEDPARREIARRRMQAGLPGTLVGARWLLYSQAIYPFFAAIVGIVLRAGDNEPVRREVETGSAQQRGGGGGGFLLAFLGVVLFVAALVFVGARLGRRTRSARNLALALEAVVVVFGLAVAAGGQFILGGIGLLAAGAIACLLAPSTKQAITDAHLGDTTARFDIRNLPEMDR